MLHQIATSLHHAAEGYLSLASSIHKVEPYELPQINHILQGEYELTNTSWSKLQNKYDLTKGRVYKALKGKRRPGGLQYRQKKKHSRKLDTTTPCTNSETN